jgi:hypothetical protein
MYTKGRKGILDIDILVTLVLIEAEFSCALYDFGKPNDRFIIIMTNNTKVIVLLHLMVTRTVKTEHLRA